MRSTRLLQKLVDFYNPRRPSKRIQFGADRASDYELNEEVLIKCDVWDLFTMPHNDVNAL